MNIKLYGTETSGLDLVRSTITKILTNAKIPFQISEVHDIAEFLIAGIDSIPAIQVDGDKIYPLKSNGSFNNSLRSAINQILENNNYGVLSKFLTPIDFSELSIQALSYGHRLATDLNAISQVLHVYRPKPTQDSSSELIMMSVTEAKEKLDRIVKMIDKDWGGDIFKTALASGYLETGFASDKILETATNKGTDLIILGTTGKSNNIKRWLGSVSADIVQRSAAPVLLIPSKAKYSRINRLLIGIDDQGLNEKNISLLLNLCSKFGTTIYLVHVGVSGEQGSLESSKKLLSTYYDSKLIRSEHLHSKDIGASLVKFVDQNKIDLIAVSPHSKSIFQKLFSKSTTQALSTNTTTPVLVLK